MGYVTIYNDVKEIRATEKLLDKLYDAAKLGLKGDSLALSAGIHPQQYKRLCEHDPQVELTVKKGKADAELEHARMLAQASLSGDAKATLAILQHVHGWENKAAQQQFGANGIQIVIGNVDASQPKLIEGTVVDG